MMLTDFSRIEAAVDVPRLRRLHFVVVGAGASFSFVEALVRFGVKRITVLDFDGVENSNLVRQGYFPHQEGMLKIDALEQHVKSLNPSLEYIGISKNFLDMKEGKLDEVFGTADFFCFLTDSFAAQCAGNLLALKYRKPAVWAGFYEGSLAAEIVFFLPGVTSACFRCCVSPRYEAQLEETEEIKASSQQNTFAHGMVLDGLLLQVVMAMIHNDVPGFAFSGWFGKKWDRNLIQFRVHPDYSNKEGNLFHRVFLPTEGRAFTFNAIWQKIEPEKPPTYPPCPDCGGDGRLLHSGESFSLKRRRNHDGIHHD